MDWSKKLIKVLKVSLSLEFRNLRVLSFITQQEVSSITQIISLKKIKINYQKIWNLLSTLLMKQSRIFLRIHKDLIELRKKTQIKELTQKKNISDLNLDEKWILWLTNWQVAIVTLLDVLNLMNWKLQIPGMKIWPWDKFGIWVF